jgi:hypothetical protein
MPGERCQKRAGRTGRTFTKEATCNNNVASINMRLQHFARMPLELITISEAESRAGLARSTIVRWLKAGRMKKRAQGKVAISDLERCIREQRTGRPCMSGRYVRQSLRKDTRPLAEKNMETYCGTQGLRRLGAMIKALAWELARRGKDLAKLRYLLAGAYAETNTIATRHAEFEKLYGPGKRT